MPSAPAESCAPPERDEALSEPKGPASGRFVVLGEREELERGRPAEPRIEIALDPTVRNVAAAQSHRGRLDVGLAAVVEHDVQLFAPGLDARDEDRKSTRLNSSH